MSRPARSLSSAIVQAESPEAAEEMLLRYGFRATGPRENDWLEKTIRGRTYRLTRRHLRNLWTRGQRRKST